MKRLWVAAALAPLSFAAAAQAQVTINDGTKTPIATATVNNGAPDDIVIGSGGSVDPTTAGTAGAQAAAVTLNSNNNVSNAGSISIKDFDYTTGIAAQGGFTGSVTNTGAISLNESSSPKTNGTNGIAEGPFATGTNKFGIQITGTSPLIGTLTNSGSITVIGENSAAISIGSGGLTDLTGAGIVDSGTITVTGDNSFGIHSAGVIGGGVLISGVLGATGQNAVGVALDQGATGTVDIQAAITVTGFHSLTPPTSTHLVGSLQSSQLLPGGPAVTIGGSVGGGISIDAAVTAVAATNTTAAVIGVGGGSITDYGSTALVIGGPSAATIGAGASGYSLLIGGSVASTGLYQNFNAAGIQIGVAGGGTTTLTGGIGITGSVGASSVATNLNATDGAGNPISGQVVGLHLLAGAAVPTINISGSLIASSTSSVNNSVTALQIDSGAASGIALTNTGTISASITGIAAVLNGPQAAGGVLGVVTAVSDQAGAITSVTNTGVISATLTPIVSTQTAMGTTTALDLSHNTTGVTVTQSQTPTIPATSSTSATTFAAPSITGNVLFGSGAANLNLQAGTLTGAVSFGTGVNSLTIDGGAVMNSALTEATGGTVALSVGGVSSGTLNTLTTAHLGLSSLNIGAGGQVIFTVDPANGAGGLFAVNGNATLTAGAKIGLNLISADPAVQTFTLITTTGSLTSSQSAAALLGQTPYLFNASLDETTGPGGSVSVTVSPRTAAQLGLNPAESAAYTAVFDQLKADQDAAITADVLSKTNRADFVHLYDQFLPDFEGGPFDTLVTGQGQIAQAEADAPIKLQTDDVRGWVQEIGYLDYRQDTSDTNGYRAGGFGVIGGVEQAHGDNAVGVAAAFLTDGVRDDRQGPGALASSEAVEAGVYWRNGGGGDGLNLHASVNGGYVYLSDNRLLFDQNTAGTVNLYREAKSQWNGATVSAEFGASYQQSIGKFYVRPEVIADYIYLYESAFNEHGGGASFDLGVAARNSEEGVVQGDLVFGADLGGVNHWRPEMTLGWREVVTGGPGDTTARFLSGGPSFTLSPQFQDRGSLIARLGLRAGGNFADFSADAGGQFANNYQTYNARAVARFLF